MAKRKVKDGKIIAFDLSLSNSGFAVGEVTDGELKVIEYGSIGTKRFTKHTHGFRLNHIAQAVKELYKKYPDATNVVKERAFSNGRIAATQAIFKVVGIWELTSHLSKIDEFTDIAPTSVKKYLTGNGRASKQAVADAVKDATGIETSNNDESDAIAVLLAYCMQNKLLEGEI